MSRDNELKEIHEILITGGLRRVAVLHGLGGIDKTQLAVTYAKRYMADYSTIFWTNIKDHDSVKRNFAIAAARILRQHPSAIQLSRASETGDLDAIVDAVKRWLEIPRNKDWLIVYDNYDNPKLPSNSDEAAVDIHQYLPGTHQGSIIVTTRSSEMKLGRRIRIGKLQDLQASLDILRHASGRDNLKEG